jgi:hypothetical protein
MKPIKEGEIICLSYMSAALRGKESLSIKKANGGDL